MTEEQCREVEKEILRLDPERVRLFLDENWVVHIVNNGRFMGWIHPLSFLDLSKEIDL